MVLFRELPLGFNSLWQPESGDHKLPESYQKEHAISALKDVITQAGFNAEDLQIALGAIASAKELSLK